MPDGHSICNLQIEKSRSCATENHYGESGTFQTVIPLVTRHIPYQKPFLDKEFRIYQLTQLSFAQPSIHGFSSEPPLQSRLPTGWTMDFLIRTFATLSDARFLCNHDFSARGTDHHGVTRNRRAKLNWSREAIFSGFNRKGCLEDAGARHPGFLHFSATTSARR